MVFGAKQNLNATITLNQLLFDGSYLVGLQSAKTYLKISNLAKEKTDQNIREAVINAYGNVFDGGACYNKGNVSTYCSSCIVRPFFSFPGKRMTFFAHEYDIPGVIAIKYTRNLI